MYSVFIKNLLLRFIRKNLENWSAFGKVTSEVKSMV